MDCWRILLGAVLWFDAVCFCAFTPPHPLHPHPPRRLPLSAHSSSVTVSLYLISSFLCLCTATSHSIHFYLFSALLCRSLSQFYFWVVRTWGVIYYISIAALLCNETKAYIVRMLGYIINTRYVFVNIVREIYIEKIKYIYIYKICCV